MLRSTRTIGIIGVLALVLLGLIRTVAAEVLDRIVAVVNDDIITASELADGIELAAQQIAASGSRVPPPEVLQRQVLERLIVSNLQLRAAQEAGIQVDDQTVNAALVDIARRNGITLAALRQAVEADGFDFAEFRENVRIDLLSARLRQRMVDSRITTSEQEVDDVLATQGSVDDREYHLRHILISVPEGASPEELARAQRSGADLLQRLAAGENFADVALQASDGREALEGGDLGWRQAAQIPTVFAEVIRRMEPGDVSDLIRSPSGFHIIKVEEVRGGSSRVIRQTRARHILVRPNEVVSDEEANLRLERLRARILGGDDFAELAKANSEDTVSAIDGGDLGWSGPGQFDPAFEQAMNELAPGEISAPVQSSFGWHLIQVLERRDRESAGEFQRSRARETLLRRKSEEEWELYLRRLRDEAYVEYRIDT